MITQEKVGNITLSYNEVDRQMEDKNGFNVMIVVEAQIFGRLWNDGLV